MTTLAKAKAKTNETFIVQASLTIATYDCKNMFIVQTTGGVFTLLEASFMIVKVQASLTIFIYNCDMFIVHATGLNDMKHF